MFGVLLLYLNLNANGVEYPYFFEANQAISGRRMGEFQPIYLYSYKFNDGLYYKVVYKNKEDKFKLMDLFTGGKIKNYEFPLAAYYKNDTVVNKDKRVFGSYKFPFKFNQRIRVRYLIDAGEDGNKEVTSEICEISKLMCDMTSLISEEEVNRSLEFYNTNEFAKDSNLPILAVYDELRKD